MRRDRKEEPLEAECPRHYNNDTTSQFMPYGKGQIVCPVVEAVAVAAPPKPQRVAEPQLPEVSPAGDAAVAIFFAQYCPGYITPAARQVIHTFGQFRAREASQPYDAIKTSIVEAAKANRTRVEEELQTLCMAAEPRINAIEKKLGEAFNR
jgi:hypothetical protein